MANPGLFNPRTVERVAYPFPGAATAQVAGVVEAGGVGAAAGGWDTAGHRDTSITTIGEIKTVVNAIEAALTAAGVTS